MFLLTLGYYYLFFLYIASQGFDETVNMANWDMYFYTRGFPSMDSRRSMRHVSKLLTYPITVASILHESCPYKFGKEITVEGMRSLSGKTLLSFCLKCQLCNTHTFIYYLFI